MRIVRMKGRGSAAARSLLASIEQRGATSSARLQPVVRKIVADVRRNGDKALLKYARKLDGLGHSRGDARMLRVSSEEMESAWSATPLELKAAMKAAAKNIRAFAQKQKPRDWSVSPAKGARTGQIVRPLASVGCYVPGGRYPLPSTVLMAALPAKVAGVARIVVVSPKPARETLAAAWLAGVDEFHRIGGAQAIAALAYGTESIEPVDKIVGPGNLYVTTAKKLVAFDCAIDMLAGPTEIVVASEIGDPSAIAADLVAQAEHDPEALAILVTSNAALAASVARQAKARSAGNAIAKQALQANGAIFIAANIEQAREIVNRLAPEHLTIDAASDLDWVRNAGSVFIGTRTPQAMGDYISGPNHVLPTGRLARVRGGLSVMDFLKVVTVQEYSPQGLTQLGRAAILLAEAEGLRGHAESVRLRMKT